MLHKYSIIYQNKEKFKAEIKKKTPIQPTQRIFVLICRAFDLLLQSLFHPILDSTHLKKRRRVETVSQSPSTFRSMCLLSCHLKDLHALYSIIICYLVHFTA